MLFYAFHQKLCYIMLFYARIKRDALFNNMTSWGNYI
jgi:hypothetical protein